MKKAIILHGYPDKAEYYSGQYLSSSNGHWLPWLQRQLQLKDISAQTPEVFMAWQLKYEDWARELDRYEVDADTMLIGHSCGGGVIVRWLSEHPKVSVDKVVLVAPWLDPQKEESSTMFNFVIDPNIAARTKSLNIFISDNEPYESVKETVGILKEQIADVAVTEFKDHGHFCLSDMGTEEFPELLDHLLKS